MPVCEHMVKASTCKKTRKPEIYGDKLRAEQVETIRLQARNEVLEQLRAEVAQLDPQARKLIMTSSTEPVMSEEPEQVQQIRLEADRRCLRARLGLHESDRRARSYHWAPPTAESSAMGASRARGGTCPVASRVECRRAPRPGRASLCRP
jgi:hypothetical protein